MFTNWLEVFLKSLTAGLASSLPLGVVGVLCIRETVTHGRSQGVSVAIGAACAEMTCALISALGGPYFCVWRQYGRWLNIVLGCVLVGMALSTLSRGNLREGLVFHDTSVLRDKWCTRLCVTAFLLIITNPLSVLAMAALMGTFNLQMYSWFSLVNIVFGVFLGSILWWSGVVWSAQSLGTHLSMQGIKRLYTGSTYLVLLLGAGLILEAIFYMLAR